VWGCRHGALPMPLLPERIASVVPLDVGLIKAIRERA
jgi:hypothetical protein